MAEPLRFESPIRIAAPPGSGFTDESTTIKTLVRAPAGSDAALRLGVEFGSSRRVDEILICGTRPDEWLVLGEPSTVIGELDVSGPVSVVDLTHGRALLRLTGERAVDVLEKVCGLDLSEAMTPDGAVTSATVASVICDVIRDDRDGERSYLIACDRSLGDYLAGAIVDAAGEFA